MNKIKNKDKLTKFNRNHINYIYVPALFIAAIIVTAVTTNYVVNDKYKYNNNSYDERISNTDQKDLNNLKSYYDLESQHYQIEKTKKLDEIAKQFDIYNEKMDEPNINQIKNTVMQMDEYHDDMIRHKDYDNHPQHYERYKRHRHHRHHHHRNRDIKSSRDTKDSQQRVLDNSEINFTLNEDGCRLGDHRHNASDGYMNKTFYNNQFYYLEHLRETCHSISAIHQIDPAYTSIENGHITMRDHGHCLGDEHKHLAPKGYSGYSQDKLIDHPGLFSHDVEMNISQHTCHNKASVHIIDPSFTNIDKDKDNNIQQDKLVENNSVF